MFRLGDYVGANVEDPQFGRIERIEYAGYVIRAGNGDLHGPYPFEDLWPDISAHVDYPHHPGTLHDCPACEAMGTLEDN